MCKRRLSGNYSEQSLPLLCTELKNISRNTTFTSWCSERIFTGFHSNIFCGRCWGLSCVTTWATNIRLSWLGSWSSTWTVWGGEVLRGVEHSVRPQSGSFNPDAFAMTSSGLCSPTETQKIFMWIQPDHFVIWLLMLNMQHRTKAWTHLPFQWDHVVNKRYTKRILEFRFFKEATYS